MNPAARIFLSGAQRRLLAHGWGVFVFHKVAPTPPQTRDPFEYTSPRTLDQRLAALRGAGFQPATLDDLHRKPARLEKPFVVTFDDGYAHLVDTPLILETLARQGVSATVFLVAGKLGAANDWDILKGDVPEKLMNVAQVKTWLAAGHRIGSHSLTHANFRRISPDEARGEILDSKKKLEDTFGVAVNDFCYPFGRYFPFHLEQLAEAGYRTGCTMRFGVYREPESLLEIPRLAAYSALELTRKAWHRCRRRLAFRAGAGNRRT